jgi:hypothetical protein
MLGEDEGAQQRNSMLTRCPLLHCMHAIAHVLPAAAAACLPRAHAVMLLVLPFPSVRELGNFRYILISNITRNFMA